MVFCFLCVAFSIFKKVKKLKLRKKSSCEPNSVLLSVEMLVCSLYDFLSSTGFEMFSSHFLPECLLEMAAVPSATD